MPILTDDDQTVRFDGANFGFSAVRPEALGATEYTLVTIVVDRSGSVSGFEDALTKALRDAIKSCEKSPRSDNLLVRYLKFNQIVNEVHGFETLRSIDPTKYKKLQPSGMTSLYDASYDAVIATIEYAKVLAAKDFDTNAIIFIVSDGMDNDSSKKISDVKKVIADSIKSEDLESIITILIGVNLPDKECRDSLNRYHVEAGITQFVDIKDFDDSKGAKLAEFISKSTSSQSQSLGTGGPSQTMTF